MANEVELETLIVPIRADVEQLKMGFSRAEQQIRQTVARIDAEMAKMQGGMEKSVHSGTMSAHSMHRMLHMMVSLPDINNGTQAFQRLGHMAMYVGRMFGPIGMIIGAAIGFGITAVKKFDEQLNKAQKSADEAFGAILKGSKSISQGMADVGKDLLEKEFKEINEFWNREGVTGRFQRGWSRLFGVGSMNADLDRAFTHARESETAYQSFLESQAGKRQMAAMAPRVAASEAQKEVDKLRMASYGLGMGEQAAGLAKLAARMVEMSGGAFSLSQAYEHLRSRMDEIIRRQDAMFRADVLKKARDTAMEIVRIGMGANQAAVFRMAQEQAAKMAGGPGAKTASELMAGPEIDLYRQSLAALALGKVWEDTIKLGASVDKLNQEFTTGSNAAERYAKVVDYARSNNVSLEEAARRLEPVLRMQADLQEALSRKPLLEKIKELGQEAGRIGLLADASQRLALAQRYAWETGMDLADAMGKIGSGLARMQYYQDRLAGAKLFEETMTPIEKYAIKVQELDRLLANGAISQETWNRQVIKANNEILKLNAALNPVQAAKWPSAEAMSRLDKYRDSLQAMMPIVQAAPMQAALGDLGKAPERQPEKGVAVPPEMLSMPSPTSGLGGAGLAITGIGGAIAEKLNTNEGSWALAVSQSAREWSNTALNSGLSFSKQVDNAGTNFFSMLDEAGKALRLNLMTPAQRTAFEAEQRAKARVAITGNVPSGIGIGVGGLPGAGLIEQVNPGGGVTPSPGNLAVEPSDIGIDVTNDLLLKLLRTLIAGPGFGVQQNQQNLPVVQIQGVGL